mmetsp:Transcript_12439/g.24284  ORF Transcript_12439/g.24284 Transcript_12439/m.24284 type:complete len:202 (+) Transcript_12439:463-1068(+)
MPFPTSVRLTRHVGSLPSFESRRQSFLIPLSPSIVQLKLTCLRPGHVVMILARIDADSLPNGLRERSSTLNSSPVTSKTSAMRASSFLVMNLFWRLSLERKRPVSSRSYIARRVWSTAWLLRATRKSCRSVRSARLHASMRAHRHRDFARCRWLRCWTTKERVLGLCGVCESMLRKRLLGVSSKTSAVPILAEEDRKRSRV